MRLIDADALMQDVIAHSYPLTNAFSVGGVDDGMFTNGFQQVVDEQPTIDAVPVWKIKNRMKYLLNAEAIKPHDYNFVWNVIIHGTPDEIKEWGADGERRSDGV